MAADLVPATAGNIERAARLLRAGELVAFPTETVYGLGGDATNEAAVARIFAAKGRPRFNPLIVHVPDVAEAKARLLKAGCKLVKDEPQYPRCYVQDMQGLIYNLAKA